MLCVLLFYTETIIFVDEEQEVRHECSSDKFQELLMFIVIVSDLLSSGQIIPLTCAEANPTDMRES